MKTYKARSLFTSSGRDYVAIPATWVADAPIMVQYESEFMMITTKNWTPVWSYTCKDKYGRGTYELCYYLWKGKGLWETS